MGLGPRRANHQGMNVIDLIRTSFENASKNPTPKTVDVAKVTADELAALPADMRTAVTDAQKYAEKNSRFRHLCGSRA